jgi:hypothetical protein
VLDVYTDALADKADAIRERDEEIDAMYTSLFRELLTYMMEDPRNITSCTHLLFCAKNIERIGDHATNIAETIYYMATGASRKAIVRRTTPPTPSARHGITAHICRPCVSGRARSRQSDNLRRMHSDHARGDRTTHDPESCSC